MTLDMAIAAAERTEAARNLIDQAQADVVDLVTVSALELCVLGGPRHALFDESVAHAWMRLGDRRQKKAIEWVTEGMVERGLLIAGGDQPAFQQNGGTYALKPELGLMLAARCRPSSIVVTEAQQQEDLRTPRFFALGDQAEPVRGVVVEQPAKLPPDVAEGFRNVRRLGPLGWFYRYVFISRDQASEILAELTISPPRQSGEVVSPGWVVSAYYPGSGNPGGYRLNVQGDGTKARLDGPGALAAEAGGLAGAAYNAEGLRAVMLDLITGRAG